MAYTAEVCARNAENDRTNEPGYCLQQVRLWCGIPARYGDAATAWRNTNDRHPGDRKPPRGAAVYWTGGSHGYGHIAISLGGGKIRSTDAGGSGRVATVDLGWVERNWHLVWAGWAWDINETTIPHPKAAKKTTPKNQPNPHIDSAVKSLNQAIKANKGNATTVKTLTRHRDALVKLAKKK